MIGVCLRVVMVVMLVMEEFLRRKAMMVHDQFLRIRAALARTILR